MAELRIRVRDRESKPLEDPEAEVEALVWGDGKVVATVPMESNAESGGLFQGKTPALNPGEHTVTVRVSEIYEENELQNGSLQSDEGNQIHRRSGEGAQ